MLTLSNEAPRHLPVLKKEVLSWLVPKAGDCFIDCTAGYGGHAEEILQQISPGGKLVAIDRDPEAIVACHEKLKPFGQSVVMVCDNYRNIARIKNRLGLERVDGILIDCGVSSVQLDTAERGFSFSSEGPLDMRMDPTQGYKLSDLLRNSTESELADTIFELGQERYSRRIARAIKREIKRGAIRNTRDLAETIRASVPAPYRRGSINPATRTFQALRIKINDELESLSEALDGGIAALSEGGRMVVISFHSLEDGMVKRHFRAAQVAGLGTVLTKKPLKTTDVETCENPRSRSALLRVFEKGTAA